MSKRASGYERIDADRYETPAWVTDCIVPYIPAQTLIWEPACGTGKMSRALEAAYHHVHSTELHVTGYGWSNIDFLVSAYGECFDRPFSIITNPPYGPRGITARAFIERGLNFLRLGSAEFMAMLLISDFDAAKTRQHLFGDCPEFAGRITLTKRIRWIHDSTGSPAENHAWFMWRADQVDAPIISYAPKKE